MKEKPVWDDEILDIINRTIDKTPRSELEMKEVEKEIKNILETKEQEEEVK